MHKNAAKIYLQIHSIMKWSVINNICVKHLFSFVVSNKRNKPLLTDDKAVIVKGELYQVALEDK